MRVEGNTTNSEGMLFNFLNLRNTDFYDTSVCVNEKIIIDGGDFYILKNVKIGFFYILSFMESNGLKFKFRGVRESVMALRMVWE